MSGRNPYLTAQNALESPRQLEYRLFSSVTRALMDIRPLMQSKHPADVAKIASATAWNRDVWNHLMPEVLDENNPLPKETKVSLINICLFVNKHTERISQGQATDLGPLIDINRNIMDGLK
jgi:flagellar protein FlaF